MSDRRIEIYPDENPAAPLKIYLDLMQQYGIDTVRLDLTSQGQFRIAEIRAINQNVAEAFNNSVYKQLGPDFALHGLKE